MNSLDAAERVLSGAAEPLHYQELTSRILEGKLWETEGETPEATVNARLAVDIREKGPASRFMRVDKGVFALREWDLEEYIIERKTKLIHQPDQKEKLTFLDAAELILDSAEDKNPLHYRKIMELILDLVDTEGQTPEATLYSLILTEINNQEKRRQRPRFVKYGRGMVGLRKWMGEGLAYQIDQQNREVQDTLLEHVKSLSPEAFEFLIGQLLGELGFQDIEITSHGGDKGIDVRGTLVVGGVIKTKVAVQAKKWKANVQSPEVQKVRGSLGTHEQGLIITTSGFSPGAVKEAERSDAVPVGLVDGEQLVELLIENEILVNKVDYELINLDLED